jgi:hypothetical protein
MVGSEAMALSVSSCGQEDRIRTLRRFEHASICRNVYS